VSKRVPLSNKILNTPDGSQNEDGILEVPVEANLKITEEPMHPLQESSSKMIFVPFGLFKNINIS
jgi:hypothetical protein